MADSSKIVPVLMIGGKGERFWPRSRRGMPKQFLAITSEKSMIIETYERVKPLADRVLAVASTEMIAKAKKVIGSKVPIEFVDEPFAKSTAPAIGLAARQCNPDDVMIALPADHFIPDAGRFREVLASAISIARAKEGIVCIGIAPTRPESGYGYIRPGQPIEGGFHIESFVEKPPVQRATRLIEEGALWNGGIFVVRAGVYLNQVKRYIPELAAVLAGGDFASAPTLSVDHGILEHASESYVVRGDFKWDDVGDWSSMARILERDSSGNSIRGDFVGYETKHLIVDSDVGLIAAVGVEDIAIIRDGDVVLVVKRGMEQNVKELLAQMTGEVNKYK